MGKDEKHPLGNVLRILEGAESARLRGVTNTLALLPAANDATTLVGAALTEQGRMGVSARLSDLLKPVAAAVKAHGLAHSITDPPFESFWDYPNERRHSWLIRYFINPEEDHGCGVFLLRELFDVIGLKDLTVDGQCWVPQREFQYMDILITRGCWQPADQDKYAVIIENKVRNARDQGGQLQGYFKDVKERWFEDVANPPIHVRYMPATDAKKPEAQSLGCLQTSHRYKPITFEEHITEWLEHAIAHEDQWPEGMRQGMCDNLKHYLNLIKYRIHRRKEAKMCEKILVQLQQAERDKALPTWKEVTALLDTAKSLEKCYRRYMWAEVVVAVDRALRRELGSGERVCYPANWPEEPTRAFVTEAEGVRELWVGVRVGDQAIVAAGVDEEGIYTGYPVVRPGHRDADFEAFVKERCPEVFVGTVGDAAWYSFVHEATDFGSSPQHANLLVKKVVEMYGQMRDIVAKYRSRKGGKEA